MRKEVIQIGKESEAIQKIYEDMYAHTNGTDGISMIKFSGSWDIAIQKTTWSKSLITILLS